MADYRTLVLVGLIAPTAPSGLGQARADFFRHLWPWDGFGVNYVGAAQTRDYKADPQEYGGLSTLSEDGLRPGLLKMFPDCRHQPEPGAGRTTLIEGLRRLRTGVHLGTVG